MVRTASRAPSPPERRAALVLASVVAVVGARAVAAGAGPLPARTARLASLLTGSNQHVPAGRAGSLPVPASESVADYEEDGARDAAATAHGRPLVNGYSSYFPRGYTHFARNHARLPAAGSWSALQEVGMRSSVRSSWVAPATGCSRQTCSIRAPPVTELDVEIWEALSAPPG